MSSSLAFVISWVAVLAGTVSMWAQYRRVGTQGIEGVSLATWLLFTLNGGFWIAYGAWSAHSLVIIASSVLAWPLQWSLVVRLQPWRRRRGTVRAVALFAATCVLPGVVGGWSWCVYGSGLAMTFLRVPQFVQLLRARDASGVSSASWFISASTAVLWVIYYAHERLSAALIATVVAGSASATIGALAVWRHHQEREEFVRREVFAS